MGRSQMGWVETLYWKRGADKMDMAGRIDETLRTLLNVMVYVVRERIKIGYVT